MKVLKFGGSSLADANQFKKVKDIALSDEERKYIVVSAPGKGVRSSHKVTDLLLMCYQLASHDLNFNEIYEIIEKTYKEIVDELELSVDIDKILKDIHGEIQNGASKDFTASRGEYINAILLADYLGWSFVDAKDIIFFNRGDLDEEKTEREISKVLQDSPYTVIPGFYGQDENGKIKTFSRGGSDITGSLIANALKSEIYENWTDVSGFLVADPKIVENSKTIDYITYRELRELSYMGAPVLHEDSIVPVKKYGIPINIRNTNAPSDKGTTIIPNYDDEKITNNITGIAGKRGFSVITIEKTFMNTEYGFFRKIMSVFETNEIPIEHMPSSIDTVSLIVDTGKIVEKLDKIIEEIKIYTNPKSISVEHGISLIAIVGKGMVNSKGTSGKIFTALGNNDVNVRMISQGSSELNIIIGVLDKDFEKAIKSIYEAFN
ncbi:aspartate kinase [Peptoniphilus sp.]|jgi:aspartate kinase|uniref:aspartate kinase n=1 Tax=Peptoniphilus sp. TaxID=1971214 RepID=UPI003D8CCCD4